MKIYIFINYLHAHKMPMSVTMAKLALEFRMVVISHFIVMLAEQQLHHNALKRRKITVTSTVQ